MPHKKLTKRIIDAAKCPKVKQEFIRDTLLPGFAIRLTPASKTFIFERRINGLMRRMTIGRFGDLTVHQARTKAQELAGEIAKGEDPAQARKDKIQEARFFDLETLYLERHAPHKKSAHNDISLLNNHLASWRNRKLSAISRNDVIRLHTKMGAAAHPIWANRMVALVRKMFSLAKDWGFYQEENPATRIQMFKETSRDRYVHPHELPRLFEALSEEPNPYIRVAFLVALLTGPRRSEILTMRWIDLHFDQRLWHLPETKSGAPHYIPLPQPLCNLLKELPKVEGNPYVFVGRYGKGHLANISRAWKRIRKRAQLEDVRIHDLRRTLGSWLAASGANLVLIGKVLNHSHISTTAIYSKLDVDPVREALESNAQKMLALADSQSTAVGQENRHTKNLVGTMCVFTQ